MPTYGALAGRAKMSATATSKGSGLAESEADCSTPFWTWCERLNQGGSSLKTSLAYSRRIKGRHLRTLSTRLKKSGIWGDGLRLTRSISACPKTESASSLSQVLLRMVPIKSLLTAANCRGIIRREENNGRKVPPKMREALEETIRLCSNVGEASGTPEETVFAPRYVPSLDAIKEAIQTDRYCVARNLTWTEWERLMGFPDDWTVVEADSSETP